MPPAPLPLPLLVLVLVAVAGRAQEVARREIVIGTRLGRLQGRLEYAETFNSGGSSRYYYAFRGIPYARPPIGDLRWAVSVLSSEGLYRRGAVSGGRRSLFRMAEGRCIRWWVFKGAVPGSECSEVNYLGDICSKANCTHSASIRLHFSQL